MFSGGRERVHWERIASVGFSQNGSSVPMKRFGDKLSKYTGFFYERYFLNRSSGRCKNIARTPPRNSDTEC